MELNDIINDNLHGSEYLAEKLIDILISENKDFDFNTLLNKKGMMGEILNILYIYKYFGKDYLISLKDRLRISKNLILNYSDNYLKDSSVGVISNSSTILYVIKNSKVKEVNVLESLPGGEGKIFYEEIRNIIDSNFYKDDDMDDLIKNSDILISGSDIFNRKYFVNKIKTGKLFLNGKSHNKKNMVITSSLKYYPWDIKINDIFEKIPWNYVDFVITDRGTFSPVSNVFLCKFFWPLV
jgi:translation initiation factor 2B subunit (eIF-2B alpha/beta/delta family)